MWQQIGMGGGAAALRDPAYELARATNFEFYRDDNGVVPEWIPVIMELSVTARRFSVGLWAGHGAPADWQDWIKLPPIYGQLPGGLEGLNFCTATVKTKFFQQLRFNTSLRLTVRRFELCMPLNVNTGDIVIGPSPTRKGRPDGVVMGIIDDGLAFAHRALRLPNGETRVEYFWDQNDPSMLTPGLGYGRERRKDSIGGVTGLRAHMANATRLGLVDEDQVYGRTGQMDFQRSSHKSLGRRVAHGTHVMHAACATDAGVPPDARPIVCVQFPSRAVEDTSGGSAARHILDGLIYILKRAEHIAVKRQSDSMPVVVNVSFGNIAGPHDGSSPLERAIDRVVGLRNAIAPTAVVLPSGNSHLARCHARFLLSRGRGRRKLIEWRVQPDDATPSHLQIWLPSPTRGRPLPRVEVRITDPLGNQSPWIPEDSTWVWQPGASILCAVTYLSAAATGHSATIRIWLAPSATVQSTRDPAPSGKWRVETRRVGPGRGFWVHAWIQRDDRPYGYPIRGRQSYFDDPRYVRFEPITGREVDTDNPHSYVQRRWSMNAFATGREAVVIGGFRRSDLKMWKHSAGGPIVFPTGVLAHRDGPDAVAVSEDTPAFRGQLAAGTRSGSIAAMNGTSVAAPQIAREIANIFGRWLAAGAPPPGPGNGRNLTALLAQGDEAMLQPGTQPPSFRAGAGRILRLRSLVDRGIEP